MPRIYFKFFTRSVERREPEIFIDNLKQHFGDKGLPDEFAANDDESFAFNDKDVQKFEHL